MAHSRPLITTVRVETGPAHYRIHIWARGQKIGTLTCSPEDAGAITDRLFCTPAGELPTNSVLGDSPSTEIAEERMTSIEKKGIEEGWA